MSRTLLPLIAVLGATACMDDLFVAPARETGTALQISYTLAGGNVNDPAAAFDKADRLRVHIADTGVDTVVAFAPAAETHVRLHVPAASDDAAHVVALELRRGSDVLFSGSTTAHLRDGATVTAVIPITPVPAAMTMPDSIPVFTALGDTFTIDPGLRFATGEAIPNSALTWTSTNPTAATVDANGRVRSVGRGAAHIEGSHPAAGTQRSLVRTCVVEPLGPGTHSGQIDPDDCQKYFGGVRGDHYEMAGASGVMSVIQRGGALAAPFGIKDVTADPRAFNVLYATSNAAASHRVRIVSNGEPVHVWVENPDSVSFGAYTLTRTDGPATHTCSEVAFVMSGASFGLDHNGANSCHETVQFTPLPEAMGQPLHSHYFYAKLVAGTHTVTVDYSGSDFNPALTVYRGGEPVAQSVPDGSNSGSRSVTFEVPSMLYHTIEVSSGHFTDGSFTTWVTPSGSYALTLSR